MPDLSCELFQWWVDMAETLQARVPSSDIIAQAKVIIADAERYVQQCRDNGQPVPKLNIPQFNSCMLSRWRREWGLTVQSVNAKYKVSFAMVERRMGVLLRNAARLLVFHELLYGAGKLVFVSIDEKPYYFNAIGGQKIWARRGSKKKRVKDKRAAMFERWTGMAAR